MLTESEAAIRNRIKAALDLQDLCRQFGAMTEIPICCLAASEVSTYTHDLMALRRRYSPAGWRTCPLPAGLFRPRRGEPGLTENHRHG